MKILSLKAKGLVGLKKGIGIEEINLDFSNLSGLIALAGVNGKGKSTVLESLPPYAMMASKDGAIQNHYFLQDSFREQEYLFNGDLIRTRLDIRGGTNYTPDGYIWINDQPKTTGKISEYKGLINEIFGTSDLFFNSVMHAQNSKRLSDLRPAQLKDLFAEFLRLDRYIKYEDMAKRASYILDGRAEGIKKSLLILQDHADQIPENINDEITAISISIANREASLKMLAEGQEKFIQQIESFGKIAQNNKTLKASKVEIVKSIQQIDLDIQADKKQSESELATIREKAAKIISLIKENENIIGSKDKIELAVSELAKLENDQVRIQALISQCNDNIAARSEEINKLHTTRIEANKNAQADELKISTRIDDLEKQRREAKTKLDKALDPTATAALEAELKALREQSEILGKRNLDPFCPDHTAACIFVKTAMEASTRIPLVKTHISDKIKELELARENAVKEIKELDSKISDESIALKRMANKHKEADTGYIDRQKVERDLYDKDQRTKAAEIKNLEDLVLKINLLRPQAAMIDKIKTAESTLGSLREQREDITREGTELKKKWDQRINNLLARKSLNQDSIETIKKDIVESIDQKLQYEKDNLKITEKLIVQEKEEISKEKSQIENLKVKSQEKEKIQKDIGTQNKNEIAIMNAISDFKYIQAMCSKDGLRALEIDAVRPTITHYANDLIVNSFGPSSTIKIVTQDDNGKEIFDIRIIDEDGEEVSLGNRSGGQQVWPLKALQLAMARINKEKSGKNYLTLLSDEEDGALSSENAKNFVSLYRGMLSPDKQTGIKTFESCFYISHKSECVDMADHRIIFDGGITVE